jgi:putative redox protein
MADAVVEFEWEGEGLQFSGGAPGGGQIRMDGHSKAGISPVQNLLAAVAGCTAADVIDILQKMRVPIAGLRVRVEGDRAADAPRRFHTIRMHYEAAGLAAEHEDRLQRAVQLSHDKYCSVMHSLRQDISFSTEVVLT